MYIRTQLALAVGVSYYGDKVRISNANVADGAYGTVIDEIREIDQFSSNKKIVTLFLI